MDKRHGNHFEAPLRKVSGQVRRSGHRTLSKTFLSRPTALAWARRTESEVERSVYLDVSEAKSLKLSSVLTRYSEEIAITHKGWRQEQSRCKGLGERLGSRRLLDLTPSALADYREERLRQVSPKTVREELSLLQRMFNVCLKDWGITLPNNTNPLDLVRKPRGDNARERRLTADELEPIRQVPVFHWAVETAMRRGEIAAMDWKHVDLSRRSITLPVTKNGSSRTIPLSSVAKEILNQRLRGEDKPSNGPVWELSPNGDATAVRPLTADYITREFIRLCQRHGFKVSIGIEI